MILKGLKEPVCASEPPALPCSATGHSVRTSEKRGGEGSRIRRGRESSGMAGASTVSPPPQGGGAPAVSRPPSMAQRGAVIQGQ